MIFGAINQNQFASYLKYLLMYLHLYLYTFFSRADTIAVYKDSRIMSTFKETVKMLNENNDIIIFPECQIPYNDIINDFQDKFIDVADFTIREQIKNYILFLHIMLQN